MVLLSLTVTGKNDRPVATLTEDAFSITDQKLPQKLALFRRFDDSASIAIILDVSGSMIENRLLPAIASDFVRFAQQQAGSNQYCVLAFNDRVTQLSDWTSEPQVIAAAFKKVTKYKGTTALNDAVSMGLHKLRLAKNAKHVLIVVGDGQDDVSRETREHLRRALKESDAIVYVIGVVNPASDSLEGAGRGSLMELAELTGGATFFPVDPKKEIAEVFDRISNDLQSQYLAGFYPYDPKCDGKWHPVRVTVRGPSISGKASVTQLKVRTRNGYYAPLAQ